MKKVSILSVFLSVFLISCNGKIADNSGNENQTISSEDIATEKEVTSSSSDKPYELVALDSSDGPYIVFKACIDGSDILILTDGVLSIKHRKFSEIGKSIDCTFDYLDEENGRFKINNQNFTLNDLPLNVPIKSIGGIKVVEGVGKITFQNNAVLLNDEAEAVASVYSIEIYENALENSTAATEEDILNESTESIVVNTSSDAFGDYIIFEACVDGSDYVDVTNGQLSIIHKDNSELGTHFECEDRLADPEGKFLINSSSYSLKENVAVSISRIAKFEVVHGRGTVSLDNSRLLINDTSNTGSANYIIKLYSGELNKVGEYITFEACVDGSDFLSVVNGQFSITHRNYSEIGKHSECESRLADPVGKFIIDSSDHLLTEENVTVSINQIQGFEILTGRGNVSLDSENKLLIDDVQELGSSTYVIRLYSGQESSQEPGQESSQEPGQETPPE